MDSMNVMAWIILIGLALFAISALAAVIGCIRWGILLYFWAKHPFYDQLQTMRAGGESFNDEQQRRVTSILQRKADSIRILFHRAQRHNSFHRH
ncbi:hypothetical protein [Paenibacillus polymyxa]|uniref:hypothetical protein n=1 Tax=Paenibacillus polymyxa TaxID=1406 RepID=UPI001119D99A|nr:hypothetical protein [Paenibacillus polymyxa]QDA30215.1 hypothetical protein FGY93_25180 [Paenibacillus polymyxa]